MSHLSVRPIMLLPVRDNYATPLRPSNQPRRQGPFKAIVLQAKGRGRDHHATARVQHTARNGETTIILLLAAADVDVNAPISLGWLTLNQS